MDTDDLTEMAYQIIIRASMISDYLKAEIGALSHKFTNEDDYLNGVMAFVRNINADPERYLDYWFLLDETNVPFFTKAVEDLEGFILQVLATPIGERGSPPEF